MLAETTFDTAAVDAFWTQYCSQVGNKHAFDGIMFELIGCKVKSGKLRLFLRRARYAEFAYGASVGGRFRFCHPATCFYGEAGRVLLLRTSRTTERPGLLTFPGGVPDDGDVVGNRVSLERCAIRENEEEIGLTSKAYAFDRDVIVVRGHAGNRLSVVYFSKIPEWRRFVRACEINANRSEVDEIVEIERNRLRGDVARLNEYITPALETYFGNVNGTVAERA